MNSPLVNTARIDRNAFSVIDLHDRESELAYWLRQPPVKRLEGLELLRQIAHEYDPITARLPRFLTVVERSSD